MSLGVILMSMMSLVVRLLCVFAAFGDASGDFGDALGEFGRGFGAGAWG